MAQNSKIEWCDHTANLWWGCTKVHEGCDHCLSPDTLILKHDFTWVPVSDIKVGDKLISFNEYGKSLRRYQIGIVEKKWKTKGEAVEIVTNKTKIIASLNHKFFGGSKRNSWLRTENLTINTQLRYIPFLNDLKETSNYMGGYISGATLGDGTMRYDQEWRYKPHRETLQRYWRIAVKDNQTEFLERIKEYILKITGENIKITPFNTGANKESNMIQIGTKKTELLHVIYEIVNPVNRVSEFKRGWLAGLFDAEGCYPKRRRTNGEIRSGSLRISQVNRVVLKTGIAYAKEFGFNFILEETRHCATMRLIGGSKEAARFMSVFRPSISYKRLQIVDSFAYYEKDSILSLKKVGVKELVDIQTSTGTFIANGLMTHNCYAETLSKRWGEDIWGNDKPRRAIRSVWKDLYKYQRLAKEAGKMSRVFVGSMMDIFEKPMPLVDSKGEKIKLDDMDEYGMTTDDMRAQLFTNISNNVYPNLLFLFLTKRPSNINKYIPESWKINPPENVMFGTSPVNQETSNKLIPQLLQVKGRHFLSVEPQLGPVDLSSSWIDKARNFELGVIDWVIQGGESGHHRRPFNLEWAYAMKDQCNALNVPYFFKQIDKVLPIPEDLMIREFPNLNFK